MAKALDIEIDQTFFEKVMAFEHEVLRIWKEETDKEAQRTAFEFMKGLAADKI